MGSGRQFGGTGKAAEPATARGAMALGGGLAPPTWWERAMFWSCWGLPRSVGHLAGHRDGGRVMAKSHPQVTGRS